MKILLRETDANAAIIKSVGVGRNGIRAINALFKSQKSWSDLIAIDTVRKSSGLTSIRTAIHLRNESSHATASKLELATVRQKALNNIRKLRAALADADMVFVLAGLGGATGMAAASETCRVAHRLGSLTIAIVSSPFTFEGHTRQRLADGALAELDKYADVVVLIPFARVSKLYKKRVTPLNAFHAAGNALGQVVKCLGEILIVPGYRNVDFGEMKTLLSGGGRAFYASGMAGGVGKAIKAAQLAINCPFLPRGALKKSKCAIINVTGGQELMISEANEAVDYIKNKMASNAQIVFGIMFESALEDQLRVSIVVTHFDGTSP